MIFLVLIPISLVSVTSVGSNFRTRGWVDPELMCIKWQEKDPATWEMDIGASSESLVTTYKTTCSHNPDYYNLNFNSHGNIKSHLFTKLLSLSVLQLFLLDLKPVPNVSLNHTSLNNNSTNYPPVLQLILFYLKTVLWECLHVNIMFYTVWSLCVLSL
jgi:hypothetical protein